jgi:molybdopterin converting factor small subunit
VADLTTDLGVGLPLDTLLLVVNGRLAQPTYHLQEGDQVHLMPALSGG